MEYHLYPPFFVIEPQTSFSKAWEDFCRRLLNLEWKTTAIHRRTPPDRGIDLFWQAESLAYQCKAVESGIAGDFQTSHLRASIKQAQKYQSQIGWKKYILCTNVDLTGTKFENLQQMLPGIEILPAGYWIDLCQRFHEQIADRFRLLIPVAPGYVQRNVQAINQIYLRNYLPLMQESAAASFMNILLYLDRHKQIFELPIPTTFTAREVLIMLRELFELPGPKYIRESNTTFSHEQILYINNKEMPLQQRLSELQVADRPLVTICKTIILSDNGRKTEITDLESYFSVPVSKAKMPFPGPERIAAEQYMREIDRAIDQTVIRFSTT